MQVMEVGPVVLGAITVATVGTTRATTKVVEDMVEMVMIAMVMVSKNNPVPPTPLF